MIIGIISDTHNLVLPSLYSLMSDVEMLIHAGDLENTHILPEIQAICHNLVRVAGNLDYNEYPPEPEYRIFKEKGIRFFLVHNLTTPTRILGRNSLIIEKYKPDIVVFGHMHVPYIEVRNGTLFLNPGQAGWGRSSTQTALKVHLVEQQIVCLLYKLGETESSLISNHTFIVNPNRNYARIVQKSP